MTTRDPRDERIAELETEVADLKSRIEQLLGVVNSLTEKLERNSRNSSKPPSSDSPEQRAERPDRGGSSGKRGGQPGHPGAKRELLPPHQVDEFKNLFPSKCENCWLPLPKAIDASAQRFQTIELPQPKAYVTEWVRHCVACPHCDYQTWASAREIPTSPFGPRLSSVIALFTGVYHLSRRSTVRVLSDVLGVEISLGAVSATEARVSEALKPAVAEAWAKVNEAPVKHTDGTTWYQSNALCALWTIASSMVTVFKILANGQATTLAPLFSNKLGILVSDRATALTFWVMERRQICWAHLLRKAVLFSERDGPAGAFGREWLDYIAILFDYWHQFQGAQLTREQLRHQMKAVRPKFEAMLERARDAKLHELSGSCADILKHRAALWTFVETDGVEPTNNHAERELRAFVLWRKRSFGTQSERGNHFAERMMTVAHTARKQNRNVLEFLTACCTAARNGTTPPSLFATA